jgi:hypothetical protein
MGYSLSYNRYKNQLLWSQMVYRRINMEPFTVLNGILDLGFHNRKNTITIGANYSGQRLLKADNREGVRLSYHYYDRTKSGWYDSSIVGGKTMFYPNPKKMIVRDTVIRGVSSQITIDGTRFLNMSSNVTKMYLDANPSSSRWRFHVDARIFGQAIIDALYLNNPQSYIILHVT